MRELPTLFSVQWYGEDYSIDTIICAVSLENGSLEIYIFLLPMVCHPKLPRQGNNKQIINKMTWMNL